MITLACAKCGTMMRVDDGFAGGVCRCNRCGTIQTVPVPPAAPPTPSAKPAKPSGKTLYERAGRADGTDSDLAQLGEIVTSSGVVGASGHGYGTHGGNGNGTRRPRDPTVDEAVTLAPPPRAVWPVVLAIVAAALVAAGVGVGLWLGGRSREAPPAGHNTPQASADPAAPVPTGPRFGTIALTELAPVIYLVDRDVATRGAATAVRTLVLHSIASLKQPRAFQIRFVSPPGEPFAAFPAAGPRPPSIEIINQAGAWLDASPRGASITPADVAASFESALSAKPGEIVFVTASAARLNDPAFLARLALAVQRSPEVRIHSLTIGSRTDATALAELAQQSHGQSLAVSPGAPLIDYARR